MRKMRNWKAMTDNQMLEYAKDHKYEKLGRRELQEFDGGFYNALIKRNLLDRLLISKRRSWTSMTDEEILEYGKKNGYTGLRYKELREKDPSYATILYERKLSQKILKQTVRNFSKMSDQEILNYAEKLGYKGLDVSQLRKVDISF